MVEKQGYQRQNEKIWVVTVNWNQPELTYQCVNSLRKNNEQPFSLVIVDNGSTDNSVEYLQNTYPEKLIETKKNLGFSGGFNVGIRYALSQGADYIFVVNNDTISQPQMLDTLLLSAQQVHADIAAPAIYYLDSPDEIWSAGGNINAILSAPIDGHSRKKNLPEEPVKREFLTGCALLMHHGVFERIGFFDEGFFLYYEDLDLFMRAKKADLSAWLIPSARLLHHVSGSMDLIKSEDFYYWMGYSSWRYFSKHVRKWQWFFVIPWRIMHIIKLITHLLLRCRLGVMRTYIKGNIKSFLRYFPKLE